MENSSSQTELIERLGNTVKELYELLEHYAPVWYTNELREKTEDALRMMENNQPEVAADLEMRERE